MGTINYYLPLLSFVMSITAILLNGEKILARFKPKHQEKSKHKAICVKNGSFYQTSGKNITVNIDKAKKELENRDYEQAIRFLSSALLTSIDLSTESNVKIREKINEFDEDIRRLKQITQE